jgi:hypothetical protein
MHDAKFLKSYLVQGPADRHREDEWYACIDSTGSKFGCKLGDAGVVRTYEQEKKFIRRINDTTFEIDKGFVPNMRASLAAILQRRQT